MIKVICILSFILTANVFAQEGYFSNIDELNVSNLKLYIVFESGCVDPIKSYSAKIKRKNLSAEVSFTDITSTHQVYIDSSNTFTFPESQFEDTCKIFTNRYYANFIIKFTLNDKRKYAFSGFFKSYDHLIYALREINIEQGRRGLLVSGRGMYSYSKDIDEILDGFDLSTWMKEHILNEQTKNI